MFVCQLLEENDFIIKNENKFELTNMGKVASHIAEIHPLISSKLILSNDWFSDLNSIEIVSLFSLFTDVNISKEERSYEPCCKNENIQKYACLLKTYYENYDDLEYSKNIYSGYDYVDTLMYDMPNLVEEWCSYNSEGECKFFLQNASS